MQVKPNISIQNHNTFGINVTAKHFVSVTSLKELKQALQLQEYPNKFLLSGGSNILLTKDIDALVIQLNLKGISIVSEDENQVLVKAAAGEIWHEFVLWCIDNNFGGLENMSLIPGKVGTAPIQNIGAYGVELKDTFMACEALDRATLKTRVFSNKECHFDYRNSVFKQELKGKYVITNVTFKLTKNKHVLQTNYGAIQKELEKNNITNPNIKDISNAVIAIRQSKLPNPKEIGNAGSFFKNPIISTTAFKAIQENFPEIPSYPVSKNTVKVPAGWLIEKAGFKGKRFGNYGVHTKQALVLVNYSDAKGTDILKLSKIIQNTIKRIFNISIEAEVNIL